MDGLDSSQRAFRAGSPYSADALSTCFATSYSRIISFMAVATEGSFVKAGERAEVWMGMSEPRWPVPPA
jgi:hypothetical protein